MTSRGGMLPPGCRLGELSQFSCLKLKVFAEELCQRVPWNVVAFTAVVEVAMGGTGDDEQLLVVGVEEDLLGLFFHNQ